MVNMATGRKLFLTVSLTITLSLNLTITLIYLINNQPYAHTGRSHSTRFNGISSEYEQLDISASIIQGSAIGPASYVVNAADLTTVTAGSLAV